MEIKILRCSTRVGASLDQTRMTYNNKHFVFYDAEVFMAEKGLYYKPPGACIIKIFGFVIYKKDKFHSKLVSLLLSVINALVWTNTLACYGIHKLQIRNAL